MQMTIGDNSAIFQKKGKEGKEIKEKRGKNPTRVKKKRFSFMFKEAFGT